MARRVLCWLSLAGFLLVPPANAFSDAQLTEGFFDTVFGAEVIHNGQGNASRIVKKFTGPVSFHITSTASVNRKKMLRRFMHRLAGAVQNLTLVEVSRAEDAQVSVFLVDQDDYADTIRATVWDGVDTDFLEANACSAVLATRRSGIERANIYLVADGGDARFAHCMVEEIAQSLGPANDNDTLADSIFNDTSRLNSFGLFDWFILNMLYDARVRPGMTMEEVRPLLGSVIGDVRRRLPHALQKSRDLAHQLEGERPWTVSRR